MTTPVPPAGFREGSAVFLIDPEGRILLQQRDDPLPPEGYGRWAVPGGRREGSESPRDTALREFEEETGVRLQRLRFFRTVAPADLPATAGATLHLFFADDAVPRDQIAVYEGLDFQYWSPAEAGALRMNPGTRVMFDWFVGSDKYRGTLATRRPDREGVCVIALDRWGRFLLQLRDADLPPERYPDQWSIPGGILEPGEAPDRGAIREFEEETGLLLQGLRLFHVFRRSVDLPESAVTLQHCYFADPDIDEGAIDVREGQDFRYFAPDQLAGIPIPPHARTILERFLASSAYRALFH